MAPSPHLGEKKYRYDVGTDSLPYYDSIINRCEDLSIETEALFATS
jgi:hypothetical protein